MKCMNKCINAGFEMYLSCVGEKATRFHVKESASRFIIRLVFLEALCLQKLPYSKLISLYIDVKLEL